MYTSVYDFYMYYVTVCCALIVKYARSTVY